VVAVKTAAAFAPAPAVCEHSAQQAGSVAAPDLPGDPATAFPVWGACGGRFQPRLNAVRPAAKVMPANNKYSGHFIICLGWKNQISKLK
jgi:hypothetical protein